MKKWFFSFLLWGGLISILPAQVNVNINLGSQPQWGPAGYNYVDYYYLPDIETYYYVPKKQFIYLDRGHWNFANSLPGRYSAYNLYNGYKVVINRPQPYLQFERDRVKYVGYKNKKGSQLTIKQKKVKVSQGNFPSNHGHGNGKGHGNNGKGNGKGKH